VSDIGIFILSPSVLEKTKPGFIVFTSNNPKHIAIMVVSMYNKIVLPANFEKVLILPIPKIAQVTDVKIIGTAISFNKLRKMLPNGLIQFLAKLFNPKCKNAHPAIIPKSMLIKIPKGKEIFSIFLNMSVLF